MRSSMYPQQWCCLAPIALMSGRSGVGRMQNRIISRRMEDGSPPSASSACGVRLRITQDQMNSSSNDRSPSLQLPRVSGTVAMETLRSCDTSPHPALLVLFRSRLPSIALAPCCRRLLPRE